MCCGLKRRKLFSIGAGLFPTTAAQGSLCKHPVGASGEYQKEKPQENRGWTAAFSMGKAAVGSREPKQNQVKLWHT